MSENEATSASASRRQMCHCIRPYFVWNSDDGVNIPVDAERVNACR